MPAPSKTAARRWLAIELRRMRGNREPAEVGARIGKQSAAYRHYETGERLPSASDLEVLLNWYGRPERVPFFHELLRAARKGVDWWIRFPTAVPKWFNLFLGLESGAARISSFDALWIPGLFQTREYAEALYRASEQRMTDEQVAEAVELRMARQAIITREDAPQIWCILDETALRRQVGGSTVMRAQLNYLSKVNERTNVEIQILPLSSGAHAGAEGSFKILDYPPDFEGDPGTAYVDTLPQGIYYELPEQVQHYRRVFERLQVQANKPENTETSISKAKKDT